jgi:hypothetical protein
MNILHYMNMSVMSVFLLAWLLAQLYKSACNSATCNMQLFNMQLFGRSKWYIDSLGMVDHPHVGADLPL